MKSDLVGRASELERIDSVLERYTWALPALLLRGDRGIGKTALLDAAAARATARGMRVLRAFGAEFEAGLSFSALHQLLYPLRDRVDRLARQHRNALQQVLDLAPGLPPDPLVATAVLSLLSGVAAEQPLLLIVDDVPWIDPASATALRFAARRLGNDPIAFLATARTGAHDHLDQFQVPERVIGPLGARSAGNLLDIHWPGLAPPVRRRMLAEAAGNPLALRELPALLDDRHRSGQDPLPEFLPLSGRLKAAFAEEIRTLPAATREVLLHVALEPDISLAAIRGPAAASAHVDDLAPAVQADLVHADAGGRRIWFRHPLIRSAIVHQTLPGERRDAHQALAKAMAGFPERRAWHLAEAATGPDEVVARALDEAAMSAWRRSEPSAAANRGLDGAAIRDWPRAGASTAVTALNRAAELSPHAVDRSRRLIEAAYLANITGQLDEVSRLLADAGQAPDMPTGLVFATTAHLLTNQDGDVDAAYRLLTQALDNVEGTANNDCRWDCDGILYPLLLVSLYSLRPEPWELLNRAMARFEPEAVVPFRLCHDAYVDPSRTADAVREGLAKAFAVLPTDAAPWQLMPLAFAANAMDVLSDYRYLVTRMIDRERDGGAIAMVIPGLMLLCQDSYSHGQWDEAERLAQEGLDLAAVYGYHFWAAQIRALLASGAALRGNADLSRSRRTETTNWAAPRRMGVTEAYARSAGNLAAMGQGDFDEALVQVARIAPAGAPSAGIPGRWVVLDLVEAAVRSGHIDQARAHVAAAQQAGLDRIGPRIALMITGAAALTADDHEAGALFEAALSIPDAARWPWEHARIQFAYGQWLRRTHDTTSARVQLRAALETFERIGAEGLAQRVRQELRAAGVAYAVQPDLPAVRLTAQERQIADLAAGGLTNKQIAERLFLSHRTVGSHLHRLYPKLGVASRTALRAALEALARGEDAPQFPSSFPQPISGDSDAAVGSADRGSKAQVTPTKGTEMSWDSDLVDNVSDELFWDPKVDNVAIAVSAKAGTITLRGTVGSLREKREAKKAAQRVVGVLEVDNQLKVRLMDDVARVDADIRGDVLQALMLDGLVPKTVDAKVLDGLVTLTGTVEWQYQRDEAEFVASNIVGALDVFSEIEIDNPKPNAGDLQDSIKSAFKRNAALDAEGLHVSTDNGMVTIKGTVGSWAERDEAIDAAWSAPGVTMVRDDLTVTY